MLAAWIIWMLFFAIVLVTANQQNQGIVVRNTQLLFLNDIYYAVQCSNLLVDEKLFTNNIILEYVLKHPVYWNVVNHTALATRRFKMNTCVLGSFEFDLQSVRIGSVKWIIIVSNNLTLIKSYNLSVENDFNLLLAHSVSPIELNYEISSYKYQPLSGKWDINNREIKIPYQHENVEIPNLRIALCRCPPILDTTFKDGIEVLSGYVADLVDTLTYTIKTNVQLVIAEDNQYGRFIDNSWTGIMRLLVDKKADIAFGIGASSLRRDYVLFSMPYISEPTKLLYRPPSGEEWNLFSLVKPFEVDMWIGILIITIIALFIYVSKGFIEMWWNVRIHKTEDIEIMRLRDTTAERSTAIKIMITTYCFFALIVQQCYESRLTSVFSIAKVAIPFNSFEEMVSKSDYFPILMKGYKEEELLSTARIHSWKLGWKLIEKNKPYSIAKDFQEGVDISYSQNGVFIIAIMNVADILKKNCSFTYAKHDFSVETGSFAYRQNFPHHRYMNTKVLRLKELGIWSVLNERYLPNWTPCESLKFYSVSLSKVIGPIVTYFGGLLLAIIYYLVEFIIYKMRIYN